MVFQKLSTEVRDVLISYTGMSLSYFANGVLGLVVTSNTHGIRGYLSELRPSFSSKSRSALEVDPDSEPIVTCAFICCCICDRRISTNSVLFQIIRLFFLSSCSSLIQICYIFRKIVIQSKNYIN